MRVAFLSLFLLFSLQAFCQQEIISVIGVGDIMMGTNFPNNAYLPPAGGKNLLAGVNDILKDANLTFGNLEGVILDEGGTAKNCNDPKTCFVFRSPESYLQHLLTAGFDVVSTANNHVSDFGATGRINTAKALEKANLEYAGFEDKPSVIFEKEGIKYGMAAFAPNKGTASMYKIEEAKAIVKALKAECDIVIVSFHGGAEGKSHQHVTKKTEYFYGHNRGNVYDFAHQMVDAGADIIFGHGPHVTRAVEHYKDRFIAYSLGNFCTYRRFNLQGANGYAPIIKVFTDKTGRFIKASVFSVRQIAPGGPQIDDNQTAFQYLKDLTTTDFPDSSLQFINGEIIPEEKEEEGTY